MCELTETIDNMTYRELLSKWRFAPTGDPLLQGDIGKYYSKVMNEKKELLTDGEHSRISKSIGWG